MAQSLTSIYIHVVFSTKDRAPLISEANRIGLYAFSAGILRNQGCHSIAIGGTDDHIHHLVRMSKALAIGDLVRIVKSNSSAWMREREPRFAWQNGYGAFSFSARELSELERYVATQADHHRKLSFQDELRDLLRAEGVEWNESYLWS